MNETIDYTWESPVGDIHELRSHLISRHRDNTPLGEHMLMVNTMTECVSRGYMTGHVFDDGHVEFYTTPLGSMYGFD